MLVNSVTAIAEASRKLKRVVLVTGTKYYGTHLGPLRLPGRIVEPTGKSFRVRMAASFEFAPGTDKIICERPYFDQGAVVRALGL